MPDASLDAVIEAAGGRFEDVAGVRMTVDYGDFAAEYAAARSGAILYDARDRSLIEVRGADRMAWLHNLTTNTVKTLQPGDGNYAFAINVKGRILFDLNILALADALWVDIDRRLASRILAHFDRYTIAEDVQCRDRGGEFVRLALAGPAAIEIADALGVTHAKAMPSLASTPAPLAGKRRLLVRHDFAGVFGMEFFIEAADAPACWTRLLEIGRPVGLRPAGWSAVNTLRVEAGIPWYGRDIDEEVLPAETGQIERGISYVKGCYLGQEVVERMRSRNVVANRLVGLRFVDLNAAIATGLHAGRSADEAIEPQASVLLSSAQPITLKSGDTDVGRVTSIVHSPTLNAWIGLGYVRSSHAASGVRLTVSGGQAGEAEVAVLPFI